MSRESLAEQLRPYSRPGRSAARKTRQNFVIIANLGGDDPIASAGIAKDQVLRWAQNRAGTLPSVAWDHGSFTMDDVPGRPAEAIVLEEEGLICWAFRLDDPDKTVPGRTWTNEVIVALRGDQASFGFRQSVATLADDVDFLPSVPGLVRQIAENPGLIRHGLPLRETAIVVDSASEVEEMVGIIEDEERRRPVCVISLPQDQTDPSTAILDCSRIAQKCIGTAHIFILTSPGSYFLTKYVGRDFSVFNGAVRTYRKGLSFIEDDPRRHPLAMPIAIENWNEVGCKEFEDFLISQAANQSVANNLDQINFLRFSWIRRKIAEQSITDEPSVADIQQVEHEQSLRIALEEEVGDLEELLEVAQAEWSVAEDRARNSESENYALRSRITELLRQAENSGPTEAVIPNHYSEIKDWAEKNLSGRVALVPRAMHACRNAAFEDVALVYKCLRMLANEYWVSRKEGGYDQRQAFEECCKHLGVSEEPSGQRHLLLKQGDEFTILYQGRKRLLERHLKNGGNTRDPKRCLRIYFYWDEDTEQVIVGSLPHHLKSHLS